MVTSMAGIEVSRGCRCLTAKERRMCPNATDSTPCRLTRTCSVPVRLVEHMLAHVERVSARWVHVAVATAHDAAVYCR